MYEQHSLEILVERQALIRSSNQIFHGAVLAVLRRSVQRRVCGTNSCVNSPAGIAALLKEMLHRRQAVGNTVSDLTEPRFKPDLPVQRQTRYRSTYRLAGRILLEES